VLRQLLVYVGGTTIATLVGLVVTVAILTVKSIITLPLSSLEQAAECSNPILV